MVQGLPMIAMTDPRNDDKNLWVGWDEYHRLIELLALKVHESGWKFDQILCLARGGLRVGDQLSRIYDLPLAILATSSYREAAGTEQGDLDIAQYITMTRGELARQRAARRRPGRLGRDARARAGAPEGPLSGDHVGALGGALVQGLLEGEARLPRPVSAQRIRGFISRSRSGTRCVRTISARGSSAACRTARLSRRVIEQAPASTRSSHDGCPIGLHGRTAFSLGCRTTRRASPARWTHALPALPPY